MRPKRNDESETCHEAADVLFVAIGNMVSLGNAGIEGVRTVTAKNVAKTHETHAIRPDTGKLLPIHGKPHKWLISAINLTHRWPAMPHKCDAIGRI